MKRNLIGVLAVAAALCGPSALAAKTVAKDTGAVVEGNTAFALDLYKQLRPEKGNLFFSPYSISTALAMTYGGARGKTLREMANVLRLPVVDELRSGFTDRLGRHVTRIHPVYIPSRRLAAAFGALEKALKADPKTAGYELRVANRLWGRKGHAWEPAFLDLTRKHYGAGLQELDFRNDPEGARKIINAWVEKQTKDKIKELLKRGIINPDVALVLTNAIYFKGDWACQFDKKKTKDAPFGVVGPRAMTRLPRVPLMYQKGDFRYALGRYEGVDGGSVQVLELPYKGKRLSMVVLLPNKVRGQLDGSLADLEKALSPATLKAWLARLRKQEVHVYLPRFKMTCEFKLKKILQAMGMKDAFVPRIADFTGMRKTAKSEGLHISAVVHKAFVDVNEEGTEAAAATAVVMEDVGYHPPTVFRADRPFLFLIRHVKTGSILFLGRVVNPKG